MEGLQFTLMFAVLLHETERVATVLPLKKLGAEVAFSTGKQTTAVFMDQQLDEADVKKLAKALEIGRVRSVVICYSSISEGIMRAVARAPEVQEITLFSMVMKNRYVRSLTSSSSLPRLSISHTDLSSLAFITPGKTLLELDVSYNKIKDKGLEKLASLRELRKLSLAGNKITDVGVKELVKCGSLRSVDLAGNKITDLGVKELVKCGSLRSVDLSNTLITPKGIQALRTLESLEETNLSWTELDDDAFQKLCGMKTLRRIHVGFTKVTQFAVKQMKKERPTLEIVE